MATQDTFTKQILIDVSLKSDQLKAELPQIAKDIQNLKKEQQALKKSGDESSKTFLDNAEKLRNLGTQYREANKYIDNVNKARLAENNSIQQNRALLSLMTNDYVKLSQQLGKTDASTIKMGKDINDLTTKLKTQEKQIGQTYRNVGNYEGAIQKVLGTLGQVIPGLDRFSSLITEAAKGFNVMGSSAKEAASGEAAIAAEGAGAEGSLAGISAGAVATGGALLALVAVGWGFVEWLKTLTSVGEKTEQVMSGLKASASAFFNDMGKGTSFEKLAADMREAYDAAVELKEAEQELTRVMDIQSVVVAEYDKQINLLMLKMRNRKTTLDQAKDYDKQIGELDQKRAEQELNTARREYSLAVQSATIGKDFSEKKKKRIEDELNTQGLVAAENLEIQDKVNKGTADRMKKATLAIIQAQERRDNLEQKAQNRLDMIAQRYGKMDQADAEMQNKIRLGISETNNERMASIESMIGFEEDAFGRELSKTDEHYRQLIFKQQQFQERMHAVINNPKYSQKTKDLARTAITKSQRTVKTQKAENVVADQELIRQQFEKTTQLAIQAADHLMSAQIADIDNVEKRQIRTLDFTREQQKTAYNREVTDMDLQISRLETQRNSSKGVERSALTEQINKLKGIEDDYRATDLAEEERYQKEKIEIVKRASDERLKAQDAGNIIKAQLKNDNGLNDNSVKAAQLQQAQDSYNIAVSQKSLTDEAKFELEQQYLQKVDQINKEYGDKKKAYEIEATKIVTTAALQIIENGVKSAAQAKEVQLGKDKTHELANTSLTSAQKLAIENKYRILEGQAKVKEFKQEQKLAMAKTAIAGAEAIVKASPNFVLMALAAATTIAEEAVILAQKPPAYASGGTFVSDGKGSVLPGYSRKDNVNAQLRSGEAVVVSEAMRDPYARNMVSAINVAYGGRDFSVPAKGSGYAIGGIVTDGNNSNRYYAEPQEGSKNLANNIAYSLINNFPPVVVDVKDINAQQSILANTINRVNL